MSEIKEQMQELVTYLNARTSEYEIGEPTISDEEWDRLYFELKKLEEEHPTEVLDSSPTQHLFFSKVDKLEKVYHNHPMLSLDKTKEIGELQDFVDKYDEAIVMAKIDGLTISLTYMDGALVKAETRGNGVEGEDITHNALVIQNIPHHIPYGGMTIIDGEIICRWNDFEIVGTEYKHPRNYAAGSLRLLDSNICKERRLFFVAWDCIEGLDEIPVLSDKLDELSVIGFDICPYAIYHNGDDLPNIIENIKAKIEKIYYPIDGIVTKNNNVEEYYKEGNTQHHPKAAYAYKFYDEVFDTKLLDIEWSLGRTNIITPVAIFEPVEIDSTSIQRASMHNYGIMMEMLGGKPYVGQKISVTKRNMIIPNVESGEWDEEEYEKSKHIEIITKCPKCGSPLKEESLSGKAVGSILKCTNYSCEGAAFLFICHYVSKKGMDIGGISKMTLQKLIDFGWVSSAVDLYKLKDHREDWINRPGWGITSVDKILNNIEASKTCDLSKFLSALSIPLVGEKYAKELCKKFATYHDFRTAVKSKYNFTALQSIGVEKAASIMSFDYTEADEIYKYLTVTNSCFGVGKKSYGKLKGLTFCVTGKLENFKNREELQEFIENNGGTFNKTLVKSVKYLINNNLNSRTDKNIKAKEKGIEVISEEQFLKMVND